MTFVIKQCKNDLYYISMKYDGGVYIVEVSPRFSDDMCGYPIRRITYPLSDEKNARATFNRYKRQYLNRN